MKRIKEAGLHGQNIVFHGIRLGQIELEGPSCSATQPPQRLVLNQGLSRDTGQVEWLILMLNNAASLSSLSIRLGCNTSDWSFPSRITAVKTTALSGYTI